MFLKYRPDIDGLRAIAVLLVVFYHAFPTTFKGGFIGVDVFFVISGYLISGIILRQLETGSFSFKEFYARRFKRIFPALILVLFVCLIAGWILLFGDEFAALGKHIAAGAGFVANITYWSEAGYFDISAGLKPLIHLWSLGVEEQFYLFWPLFLFLIYKFRSKKIVWIGVLSLLVVSFATNYFVSIDNVTAFYMPFTRFWELFVGFILAYLIPHTKLTTGDTAIFRRCVPDILSFLGVTFIVVGAYYIKDDTFNASWALLPTIGTLLMMAAGGKALINRYILSNPILVFIGIISYPLYLWHWPLLSFANIVTYGTVSLQVRIILVIISFVLAWLTYRFIEKPIRLGVLGGFKYTPIVLLGILLFIGGLGFIVFSNKGFEWRNQEKESLMDTLSRGETRDPACLKDYKDKIFGSGRNPNYCLVIGTSTKKVFIISDSNAPVLFHAYGQELADRGYEVIALGYSGCVHIVGDKYLADPKNTSGRVTQIKSCNKILGSMISEAIHQNAFAIIMMNFGLTSGAEKSFEEGMKETISLIPQKIKLLWLLQTPRPPLNMYRDCVGRPFFGSGHPENCYFDRSLFERQKGTDYKNILSRIQETFPDLIMIDPTSALCEADRCPVSVNKKSLYDILHHLSLFGSKYLGDKISITQYFPKVQTK